jgi:hypothetical protein
MGVLSNPRHEAFAQALADGLPAYKAYIEAGFKENRGNPGRLAHRDDIRARVKELLEDLAEKTAVTREGLAAQLDQAIALAHQSDNPGAAVSAIRTKAQLYGLIEAPNRGSGDGTTINVYTQLTDDELLFELASMINEVRAANAMPLNALPQKAENDPPGK